MPITITGTTNARAGRFQAALADFSADFDGEVTAPGDFQGLLLASLGDFALSFEGQFAVPVTRDGLIDITIGDFNADLLSQDEGETGDFTPLYANNFDTDTIGEEPTGIDSDTNDDITDEVAYSGTQSWRLDINQGSTGGMGGIYFIPQNLVRGDEFWVRLRCYWPEGFDYTARSRLKFLRLHTQTPSGGNQGYNDIYINPPGSAITEGPFRFIKERDDRWITGIGTPNSEHNLQFGVWETYEYYVKLDNVEQDNGGMARVLFWKNDELLADITSRTTLELATDEADRFHFITYWNGGSPATQKMFIDDVVICTNASPPTNTDAQGNPFIGKDYVIP